MEIKNGQLKLEIGPDMGFKIYTLDTMSGGWMFAGEGPALLELKLKSSDIPVKFKMMQDVVENQGDKTNYGAGRAVNLTAISRDSVLKLNMAFIIPQALTNVIVCRITVQNLAHVNEEIQYLRIMKSVLDARNFGADSAYKFWTFQGGSYPERFDWIFPLTKTFSRQNYQGMNAPDYGGGIPVVDFWTRKQGLAFASLSQMPQLISLPVRVDHQQEILFSILDSNKTVLAPNHSIVEIPVAIISHHGDFFNGLRTYSKLLQLEGFTFPKAPRDAYQPEWCAWGYGRSFSKEQILKTLDLVKELGFGWVTIDDGWQDNDGDWKPNPKIFPGGDSDFIAFVDSIHAHGLKVRLWWVPFAAQDSSYSVVHYPDRLREYGMLIQSKVALEHPNWFLLDRDGRRVQVSWWNSYLLCPAIPEVRDYYVNFVKKAIKKWKIDGFKIDGQNLNAVPRCYNKSHDHVSPDASSKAVPLFFKDIYQTATRLRSDFLIQICPCGTNFSIYNLPFVNQTVASDPLSPWQVRLKGKTFKALFGGNETYSGDHVELTNRSWNDSLQRFVPHGEEDFASTFAVGGVPASKFTITGVPQEDSTLILTLKKKLYYKKWMEIYNKEKMSKGEYLNLYDIAFDKPEAHVIKKGHTYYYSFFSNGNFHGTVELRGLDEGKYRVYDLESGKLVTFVNSFNPKISLNFSHHMILKVVRRSKDKTK
ncbi:MAG: glycoside hydrolase family 36 protein [Candidatus Kryptoniota bacterium]